MQSSSVAAEACCTAAYSQLLPACVHAPTCATRLMSILREDEMPPAIEARAAHVPRGLHDATSMQPNPPMDRPAGGRTRDIINILPVPSKTTTRLACVR